MCLFKDCDYGTLDVGVGGAQSLLVELMDHMEVVFICLDALDECTLDTKNELL